MITRVLVKFEKMRGETSLAVLLLINHIEYWFPKRFCWNFTLNKKLGGNMIIPTWLYREKFGNDPEDEDAAMIVEKHIPEPKEPINIEADANLIR